MLVEETEAAGAITPDEASYARNVFELSEKTVARDHGAAREGGHALAPGLGGEGARDGARIRPTPACRSGRGPPTTSSGSSTPRTCSTSSASRDW